MNSALLIQDAAALRHTFQVKKRLQLEFLASLSKLLREYGVKAGDELIGSLILAIPDELMSSPAQFAQRTNGRRKNGNDPGIGPQPKKKGAKRGIGPQPKRKPGIGPQPKRKGGIGPQPRPKKGIGPQPVKKGTRKGKK